MKEKWNKIVEVWEKVSPYLPENTRMESEFRTKEEQRVYTVKGDTAILASPAGKKRSKYSRGPKIIVFIRGIRQVNKVNGNVASLNLIEYKIGSGPIDKKHWLIEAPEE